MHQGCFRATYHSVLCFGTGTEVKRIPELPHPGDTNSGPSALSLWLLVWASESPANPLVSFLSDALHLGLVVDQREVVEG